MKRALICLEQLGIGGVETFTITQVEEFERRGIKCYVLAREGLLSEKVKNKKNIEFIEFDFELKNYMDDEKIAQLETIVKEKKIDFIYVHQFSCVPYILPVVFKMKIPYIAYLHNIVPKTCEWFMETYDLFNILFPIYFECASKLIAITDRVKEEHMNLFHLPEERYITIKNSLDFSKFPNWKIEKIRQPYQNFLLFGRISEQKRNSIDTALDFYKYCRKKYNPDLKLTIVGDGQLYQEMVEKYTGDGVTFKGAVSDMATEIAKADVLLGVDRCMLEAVASKKPAVVCGYNKNIVLITPKNIKDAVEENFTGINLKDDRDELFQYNEKELIKILEQNYKYASDELAITDSVYLDITPFNNNTNLKSLFNNLNYYIDKIKELEQKNKELFIVTQKAYAEIDNKNNQLEEIERKRFHIRKIINRKTK